MHGCARQGYSTDFTCVTSPDIRLSCRNVPGKPMALTVLVSVSQGRVQKNGRRHRAVHATLNHYGTLSCAVYVVLL